MIQHNVDNNANNDGRQFMTTKAFLAFMSNEPIIHK